MNITLEVLQTSTGSSVSKANQYLNFLNTYMPKYGINSPKKISAFLANIAVESANLNRTSEIWGPTSEQSRYDSSGVGRLGNLGPDDGIKFKGRGLIQITGRYNYTQFSSKSGYNFISDPKALETSKYAAESACWYFGTRPGILEAAEKGDFLKVCILVNGKNKKTGLPNGYDERKRYYNLANQALNTGILFDDGNNTTNSKNLSSDNETIITSEGKIASANQLNFDKLNQNIQTQELDDTDVTWGNRSTSLEESDYIGLKQYIIYLVTRYYPQSLIPFVELIPSYNQQSPEDEKRDAATIAKTIGFALGKDKEDILNKVQLQSDDQLIDQDRYNKTAKQLQKLQDQGGTDLMLYDPFEEFSDSFNTPNETGITYSKKRGISYKVYGNLVLNPSSDATSLSKPGAIGLTGITIENGSQTQNGMTLITIKLKDVQGNKLLDVNSPWSFLLNQRGGQLGGDFFFRYGWQVRIPKYNSNNDYKNDPVAGKFWNHVGWSGIFFAKTGENGDNWDKGQEIKKYISSLANYSDGTLTFTQTVSEKSLMNPGYEKISDDEGKVSYKVKRDINFFDYLPLTLITPEISVNPKDGSIDATLVFRTNASTANCLCPLNGVGLSEFKTQAKVSGAGAKPTLTLTELMTAFVEDNKSYSNITPAMKDVSRNNKNSNSIYYADSSNINEWLTVIGGIGSDSQLNMNPDNIKITISNDLRDDIVNATTKDNRLLIEWLNKVLNENDMALLTSADKSSGAQLQQGFLIAYDSEKKESNDGEIKSNEDLAKIDPTFGNYLKYVETSDKTNQYYIGKRLFTQDDVFSFRFQGSLVEEINIEKLSAPNSATLQAQQNFASETDGLAADNKDVTRKDLDQNGKSVSISDKKRNLNLLYSTMLGLKVTAICHPWIQVARPCFVKGMGFWDGKYTILKVSHELSNNGKFITVINGNRILDKNLIEDAKTKSFRQTGIAMNNPDIKKAESYNGIIPRGTAVKQSAPPQSLPEGFLGSNNSDGFNLTDALNPASQFTNPPKLRNDLESYIINLHPSYQNHFRSFINDYEKNNINGYKIKITSGYRTFAEQAVLKSQNNNNASPGKSMHNYGLAIDLNILNSSNSIIASKNSDDSIWENTEILKYSKKYGLTWGGNSFGGYKDRVHFGLDKTFDVTILLYQARKQFGNDDSLVQGNRIKFTG